MQGQVVNVDLKLNSQKEAKMFNQPYLTEENRMVAKLYRDFVDKEVMPVRQQIDDDKEHKIVRKILQALTDMGHQKAAFPIFFNFTTFLIDVIVS